MPYKFPNILTLSAHASPALARQMLPLLANADLNKLRNMHPKRAINFIIGRGLLALGLQKLSPKNLPYQLKYDQKGKPQLINSPWHFNITHSHNFVIIAFATKPIGVDIEYIKPRKIDKLITYYFHPKEIDYLKSLAEDERLLKFYQLWSIKEALVKCQGDSIFSMSKLEALVNFKHLSNFSHNFVGIGMRVHHYKKNNFTFAIAIQNS